MPQQDSAEITAQLSIGEQAQAELPALRAVALSREVPGAVLLHPISFHVPRSQTLAVLGPSGSGKSTLLRLLNRLDEPTSGTVELAGQDYLSLPPQQLRRRVGMVMQRAFLFPGTAAANIAFGPAQHATGQPSHANASKAPLDGAAGLLNAGLDVDSLLEQVGLSGYAQRTVPTLSGGEAQRVAIARALANQPEILLLDEPTSSLDEASKRGIEQLLEGLIAQRGLTCVWVTHDPRQAARMANLALMLDHGRLAAFGPADELLRDHPEAFRQTREAVFQEREALSQETDA